MTTQIFGVHIFPKFVPEAEYGAIGFNLCPFEFQYYFGPIPLFLLYKMEMFTIYYSVSVVFEFLFAFIGTHNYSLTCILEETLDLEFSTILELLRLCTS